MYRDFCTLRLCANQTILHDAVALVGRKMWRPQKWQKKCLLIRLRNFPPCLITVKDLVYQRCHNSSTQCVCLNTQQQMRTLKAWQSGTPLLPVDWLCAIYKVQPVDQHSGWIRWYCSHRLFITSIQPGTCCVCAFVERCCSLNCVSLYWIPRKKS